MSKEAMKLALDLAIMHHSDDGYAELRSKVRQFAKEALAEQQEPVDYEKCAATREGHRNASEETYFAARPDLPLTTSMLKLFRDGFDRGYDASPPAQRTWVGLTDEEAQWLYSNCRTPSNLIDMTEAKLRSKNEYRN